MKKIFLTLLVLIPFIAKATPVNIFFIGPGHVGTELLKRIDQLDDPEIKVLVLANHQKMTFDPKGIPLKIWRMALNQSTEEMDLNKLVKRVCRLKVPNMVLVDCTSDQAVANTYKTLIKSNISIVTPNKKAMTGPYAEFAILQDSKKVFYETNVGAGLPIISTIKDLKLRQDKILKIEAILSGTLSYLFNSLDQDCPISEVVRQAMAKGYTEPDPREDLNANDFVRKIVILAREAGSPLEINDVQVEKFIPQNCFDAPSVEEFITTLKSYDSYFEEVRSQAAKNGKVLRLLATYEDNAISIRLQEIGSESPFYHLSGTDNMVAITSELYHQNPLVIKGPGAGKEVTASKLLAEILKCRK